jgi:predicted nucleic acid-binding protein
MVSRPVAMDASTLLNLLATGEIDAVLRSLPVRKFVCSVAAGEVLYLRHEDADRAPEPVSIDPPIDRGLLTLAKPESPEEEALFVQFAAKIDDGEAMALALCVSRGYALETDDRKARRIAAALAKPIPLLATSELLLHWCESDNINPDRIREVLGAVERRARFRPWPDYPLRDWWVSHARDLAP